jgi:hypothetical protein
MGYESYLRNDEYRSQVGATNRPENIVSRLFACKVVDVFSFHLQIFHRLRADIFKVTAHETIQYLLLS